MKKIELTRGQFALVDDEDYAELSKHKWHSIKSGSVSRVKWYAGRQYRHATLLNSKGQAKQILESMHRTIMNAEEGKCIDHIDGNPLNNQKANLRQCTHQQNLWNQGWELSPEKPFKGVHKYKGKKRGWTLKITHSNVNMDLGWFKSAEPAARAYDKIAKALFGEFARLNFPE